MLPLPDGTTGGYDATDDYTLLVKFADTVQARASGQKPGLVSLSGADLSQPQVLANDEDAGFVQVIAASDCPALEQMQSLAAQNTGVAQPDVRGLHRVVFSAPKSAAQMAALGNALQALPEIEFVLLFADAWISPPSITPTPDFEPLQSYLGPDPGVDIDYAHSIGLTGSGVRITEVSVTFNDDHEDLLGQVEFEQPLPGDPFRFNEGPPFWWNHGTATLGMLFAKDNTFGVTGMSYNADGFLYPTYVNNPTGGQLQRRETAYCNAFADSALSGPGNGVYIEEQYNFRPVEVDAPIFMLIKLATDAGVVVVEPAGNGDRSLDEPIEFGDWLDMGDSGAIMVGAGSADSLHNRIRYPSIGQGSNYGSRMDVQGWGESIMTVGWNSDDPSMDNIEIDNDQNRRYTFAFGGTSGATPMVTAAATLLQQYADDTGAQRLDSRDMRSLLKHTGIPQGTGVSGNIGPFIDLRAALDNFNDADVFVDLQSNGGLVSAIIDNAGPRIARSIAADISVTAGSPFNMTVDSLPAQCAEVPLPPGTQCMNTCPIDFHCDIDALEVGQFEALVLDFSDNDHGYMNEITISITASSSSTSLDDENLLNNTQSISIDGYALQ